MATDYRGATLLAGDAQGRGADVGARQLLAHAAGGAGGARGALDLLVERRADDQHAALRRRIEVAQALEHLEAVEVGHPQVEQDDVGPQPLDRLERRLAAVGLADELEAGVDPTARLMPRRNTGLSSTTRTPTEPVRPDVSAADSVVPLSGVASQSIRPRLPPR